MSTAIGIDIGAQTVKFAVVGGSAKAPRVLAFHAHKLEAGQTIRTLGAADFAELLKRLLGRVAVSNVVSAMPAASCLTREITVPFTRDDQIRKTIKFQAESAFHAVSIDDLVVDHYKLSEQGDKSRVLVVGLKKTLLAERLEALALAGLDPMAMDLDAAALFNTATLTSAVKEGKRVLVVDLGGATLKMVAIEGGRLKGLRSTRLQAAGIKVGEKKAEKPRGATSLEDLKRSISESAQEDTFFAGEDEGRLPVVILDEEQSEIFDFTEAPEAERRSALEKALLEVDRTLVSTRMDGPIECVYVTGGGAAVDGIEKAFADHFGAPCERLALKGVLPSKLPREDADALDLFGGVALGLALKGIGADPGGLDFRKEEFAFQGKFEKARRGVACALVLLFVLFFTLAYRYQVIELDRLEGKRDRILQYQAFIYRDCLFPDDPETPKDFYLGLKKKEADLKQRLKGFEIPDTVSALDMLRDVAQGFEESGKKCLLTKLTLRQQGSQLEVEAENDQVVYEMKNAVNAKLRTVTVEVPQVSPDPKTGKYVARFEVKARPPEKKPGKPAAPAPAEKEE